VYLCIRQLICYTWRSILLLPIKCLEQFFGLPNLPLYGAYNYPTPRTVDGCLDADELPCIEPHKSAREALPLPACLVLLHFPKSTHTKSPYVLPATKSADKVSADSCFILKRSYNSRCYRFTIDPPHTTPTKTGKHEQNLLKTLYCLKRGDLRPYEVLPLTNPRQTANGLVNAW
jgi:hypothetical protein